MLTAIVSALVVVVLSVAVIEVVLSRRAERRWRVLAQTALMELAEAANTTWSTLAEALGLPGASEMPPGQVRAALASDATGPKVRRQVEAGLMNTQLREKLAGQLGERLAEGHQILGRWAVALTASETYAEIFDQHVELYGRVGGLLQFLREGYRQTDPRGFRGRARREYSSPGGEAEDEWFVDNLIGTINIGSTSKTQPGIWHCVCCRKRGGIVVRPSSPQPPGLIAPYRLQNADPDGLDTGLSLRRVTEPWKQEDQETPKDTTSSAIELTGSDPAGWMGLE
jgi:hypothetical protein